MEIVLRFYIALRFPHKNNIRFVLAPFVCGRARLICIVCVCLSVVVSDTYCVMFFFILCALCCRFLYNFDFPFGILTFFYFNFQKMFIHKCIYVIQILVSLACLLKSLQHIEVQKYPVDELQANIKLQKDWSLKSVYTCSYLVL